MAAAISAKASGGTSDESPSADIATGAATFLCRLAERFEPLPRLLAAAAAAAGGSAESDSASASAFRFCDRDFLTFFRFSAAGLLAFPLLLVAGDLVAALAAADAALLAAVPRMQQVSA